MDGYTHQAALEAILFISGEPISYVRLATLLGIDEKSVEKEVSILEERYKENKTSGLYIIRHAKNIELATKPACAPLIEEITKSTLQESLSKAALEVLSIIAYRAPIARAEIEAIRGVNCSYTLRALLIRGLIEREGNPEDARGYVYLPAFIFLEHLGLSRIEELPNFVALSLDPRMEIVEKGAASASEKPVVAPS